MTKPATIHTDDGHALPVDMESVKDVVDAAEEWAKYFRPYFRRGMITARMGNEVIFVPAERVSFITMPLESLK